MLYFFHMKLTKSQLILTAAAVVLIVVAGVVFFRLNKKNTLSCPEGFMLMGKKDTACLKLYPGDMVTSTSFDESANLQYQAAEAFDSRKEPMRVTVFLGKPESPAQVQELLSKNDFECVGAVVYDVKTEIYSSLSMSTHCSSFEKNLPESFALRGLGSVPKVDDLIVLSVSIKGIPKVMRNFWKDNTERIRVISYFFNYKNWPKIGE